MFSNAPSQHHRIRQVFLTFDIFALIFGIVCLSLSVTYIQQLYNAPINAAVKLEHPKDAKRWNIAWFIFYAGTAPVLSIVLSLVNITLQLVSDLKPVYAIIFSPIMLLAWLLQIASWGLCELTSSFFDVRGFCYQWWVDVPADYDAGKTMALMVIGAAGVMLYGVYLGYAIDSRKKESRHAVYGKVERGAHV